MTSRIPQTFIHDVLSRTDIVEIIGARVSLKRRGNNHIACCPFHQEKTPSFSVAADKQFYYCFGCGAHGNVIDFLMQYDRMEFREIITDLATRLGIDVPVEKESFSPQEKPKQSSYDILIKASEYYQKQLKISSKAIDYLKSRGLDGKIAKRFQLGYVSNDWNNLIKALGDAPATRQALIESGLLIHKNTGQDYDRFRDRVMFPIRDVRGRVIGFGGRVIDQGDPKYLNSPETTIFHKSQELYGLYEAKEESRQIQRFLIVEGYMDVIALHQSGISYAVATLGTAFNIKHIQKLLRYSEEIVFCFDGDAAGQRAAWRALTISMPLLRDGIQLKFLFLPDGLDPDDYIRQRGKESFLEKIQGAQSLNQVFFQHLQTEIDITTPAGKAKLAKQASEYINTMPEGLHRQLLYQELAEILKVDINDLHTLYLSPAARSLQSPVKSKALTSPSSTIKTAIRCILQKPELAKTVKLDMLNELDLPGLNLFRQLVSVWHQQSDASLGEILSTFDEQDRRLLAELAMKTLPIEDEGLIDELNGAMDRFCQHHREQKLEALLAKARQQPLTTEERDIFHQLLTTQK